MKTTVTLRGIDDVDRMLSQIAPREAQNLMRSTVHDMAKQVRDDAREGMPEDEGTMIKETKHKRERIVMGKVRSTVRVGRKAFYWRFLERGDGPDRIAYDFFLKAVNKLRGSWEARFLDSFGRKLESRLARLRK